MQVHCPAEDPTDILIMLKVPELPVKCVMGLKTEHLKSNV